MWMADFAPGDESKGMAEINLPSPIHRAQPSHRIYPMAGFILKKQLSRTTAPSTTNNQ